jgi:hypothetical protein
MVIKQLKRGDIFVVYDASMQTANIIPKETLKQPTWMRREQHSFKSSH